MVSYIINVHIVWAILLLAYFSIFWRTTFFKLNRLYLIISLLIGLILPLINISINPNTIIEYNLQQIIVTPDNLGDSVASILPNNNPNYSYIIISILFAGIIYKLIKFSISLQDILSRNKNNYLIIEGQKIIITNKHHGPYSFFNNIYIGELNNYNEEQLLQIVHHEKMHIIDKHSYDNLIVELISIILWFSPFIYIFRHNIKLQHEFIADTAALKHSKRNDYLELLQFQMNLFSTSSLANNFYYSPLKSRLMMIFKTPTKNSKKLIYLILVPLSIISFLFVSCKQDPMNSTNEQISSDGFTKESNIIELTIDNNEGAFTVVEEMPRFPGCEDEPILDEKKKCSMTKMLKYIYQNIKYPEEARKNGIEGTVVISFIIEKDGTLSNIKPVKEIGGGCDEESLKVIKSMPKWIPGKQNGKVVRVNFNLPIKFKLA